MGLLGTISRALTIGDPNPDQGDWFDFAVNNENNNFVGTPHGVAASGEPYSFWGGDVQGASTEPLGFPTWGTGANGGTTNTTSTQTDPYAQWGGQTNYNNLLSGFNTQKQGIFDTSNEAARNSAASRQSSILDFIQGLTSGQSALNERGTQNELAKKQGSASILDMVGRGIRSGQTLLSNKNALDSSASEALAQAYGNLGNRQMGVVGNQYEQGNRELGLAQGEFNTQSQTGLRKFEEDKIGKVNAIVSSARQSLVELDAQMAEASMSERIAIEQEKERIKGEVLGILSQYDQQLAQGAAGVNPNSTEDRRREAFGLANAGVAANQPFNFSTEAPVQFQNSGANTPGLPLFSLPRQRREV